MLLLRMRFWWEFIGLLGESVACNVRIVLLFVALVFLINQLISARLILCSFWGYLSLSAFFLLPLRLAGSDLAFRLLFHIGAVNETRATGRRWVGLATPFVPVRAYLDLNEMIK